MGGIWEDPDGAGYTEPLSSDECFSLAEATTLPQPEEVNLASPEENVTVPPVILALKGTADYHQVTLHPCALLLHIYLELYHGRFLK